MQQQQQQQRSGSSLLQQPQQKIKGILSSTTTTSSTMISGMEALNRFGMGKRTVQDIIRIQLKLISSFWLLSYIGLRLTKQKYVPMQKPIPTTDEKKKPLN
jgi:hypothetical protein